MHTKANHPEKIRSYSKKNWITPGIKVVKIVDTECDICQKSFKTERELKHHIKSWHTESKGDRYQCDQCDISYTSNSSLTKHKQSKHLGIRYTCDNCGKSHKRQTELNEHIRVCQEGVEHKCPICHKVYTAKKILVTHMKKIHQRNFSEKANDFMPKLNSIEIDAQDSLDM